MIPDYERFFAPCLRAIEGGALDVPAVASMAARALGLGETDRAEVIAYDGTPVHVARAREALRDLRRAGLVDQSVDGEFRLTDAGRAMLDDDVAELDRARLGDFPDYAAYRQRYLARRGA